MGNSSTPDWRKSNIRVAQARIIETPAPAGVTQRRWRAIQELLIALAEFLPTPYPTQEHLCQRMGVSPRMLRYKVAWAVEAGALSVSTMPSRHGYWPHNVYEIKLDLTSDKPVRCPWTGGNKDPFVASGPEAIIASEERPPNGGSLALTTEPLRGSSVEKREVFRRRSDAGIRPLRKGSPMSDWDPDFSQGVSDDDEGVQPAQRKLLRRRTPVGQVTHHFREGWAEILNAPGGGHLRMAVLFDSVAAFQSRIKTDSLDREGHTVTEVCDSIDLFLHDVAVRRVVPKNGQPVWKLWWNRRVQYQRPVASEAARNEGQLVQDRLIERLRGLDSRKAGA